MFAAVLSAFLVYTIPQLQPSSIDVSKDILLHISLQLSNSSVPAFVEPQFFVSPNVIVVNALLLASLALVLVDAYLAMVTRGWVRDFDRTWRSSNVPEERARKREMRLQGLERWKLHWVVALLPLLIQTSLLFFGAALLIMLFNLYRPIAYPTLVILAFGTCFFVSTTVAPTLDPSAPFTCPVSNTLQSLIHNRWSYFQFSAIPQCNRSSWRPMHTDTDSTKADVRLAISDRLYTATSKAVENVPVFITLFDQWVHTPSFRPRSLSEWRQILPLIQPYLSNASFSEGFRLRTVARLFLCFNSKETSKGRHAVIAALEKDVRDTGESSSIEQLYIQLLYQSESGWSLACTLVPRLKVDRDTLIELRWTLNWILSQSLADTQEPSIRLGWFWHSSLEDVIPFLRSIAIYIIQNQLMNEDHGLFNLLLIVTRSIADGLKEVDNPHTSIKSRDTHSSSGRVDGGLFISVGDFLIPPESQWQFVRDLYDSSPTSNVDFKHDFTLLVILIMIGTLITVEHSDIHIYDRFINPEQELPLMMDGLWETWKTHSIDHNLLTGVAVWLLERSSGSLHSARAYHQHRRIQEIVNAYDSYTSNNIHLMTSNALRFIESALLSSLETAKDADGESQWEPQTLELRNPWFVMHIHNILHRAWCTPRSTMREAVWDRLDPLTGLNQLNRHSRPVQLQKSPTVLKAVARSRLDLYNAKVLRLDPVALSLLLSPRNEDIFNDSRHFILELFRSTPSAPSQLPTDTTRLDTMDFEIARVLCSDFFESKVIGDLTKWRLLASVMFPEWETLSAQWKDLLAAGVMEVKYRVQDGEDHRVDWMARVTPQLEGEFNLNDFGLSKDDSTYGHLTPMHLRMVVIAVEHFGAERLTHGTVRELEKFLGQHSNLLCDKKALRQIWMVIRQVKEFCALESLIFLFSDQP